MANYLKQILILLFFACALPAVVFSESTAQSAPNAKTSDASQPAPDVSPALKSVPAVVTEKKNETSSIKTIVPDDPDLREARALVDSGKLLEARERYRSLLTQADIPKNLKKNARKELDDLNINILFSPIQTEDSIAYTVEEGDNLHNIAKKYKTTIALIQKSNHLKSEVIRPGQKLKVSTAKYSIEVDKSDNTLKLLSDDMVLKTYRVGTGADNSTPVGEFTITTKIENPTWYHGGKAFPPDSPDNILGTRWMGFSLDSYGIHGTTLPDTIGTQASSGCVRMYNHEVEELYTIVPVGTHVMVKD